MLDIIIPDISCSLCWSLLHVSLQAVSCTYQYTVFVVVCVWFRPVVQTVLVYATTTICSNSFQHQSVTSSTAIQFVPVPSHRSILPVTVTTENCSCSKQVAAGDFISLRLSPPPNFHCDVVGFLVPVVTTCYCHH